MFNLSSIFRDISDTTQIPSRTPISQIIEGSRLPFAIPSPVTPGVGINYTIVQTTPDPGHRALSIEQVFQISPALENLHLSCDLGVDLNVNQEFSITNRSLNAPLTVVITLPEYLACSIVDTTLDSWQEFESIRQLLMTAGIPIVNPISDPVNLRRVTSKFIIDPGVIRKINIRSNEEKLRTYFPGNKDNAVVIQFAIPEIDGPVFLDPTYYPLSAPALQPGIVYITPNVQIPRDVITSDTPGIAIDPSQFIV